jgi:mannose-6-phosphate isomerase-like protein (cupin superfamily)
MDPRFNAIADHPSNAIFNVVFFPDRIYHAQYLNATRSTRYRYDVLEVRSKTDAQVMKGTVYLDGEKLSNFVRIEYRGSRLVEQARERSRFLGRGVVANVKFRPVGGPDVEKQVRLEFCPWIDAYQAEIWETLEPPRGQSHDYQVLAMMGKHGSITRFSDFVPSLRDMSGLRYVELSFREDFVSYPSGHYIASNDAGVDNFYQRNIQVPKKPEPSSQQNTVLRSNYLIDFQRNFFIKNVSDIDPVNYRNAMMDGNHPRSDHANIVEMRWVFQEELGSDVVFFHEVTVNSGVTEGTHQHIGSEELYFITEGTGLAYMGEHDDPDLSSYPVVDEPVFGLGTRRCRSVPVTKGSVIYTKSGGIHGIRNTGDSPLKFVAFLYHAT